MSRYFWITKTSLVSPRALNKLPLSEGILVLVYLGGQIMIKDSKSKTKCYSKSNLKKKTSPVPAPLPLLGTALPHPDAVHELLQVGPHHTLPLHLLLEQALRLCDRLRVPCLQNWRQDLLPQQLLHVAPIVVPPELGVDVLGDLDQHPVHSLPGRRLGEHVRPGGQVVEHCLPHPQALLLRLQLLVVVVIVTSLFVSSPAAWLPAQGVPRDPAGLRGRERRHRPRVGLWWQSINMKTFRDQGIQSSEYHPCLSVALRSLSPFCSWAIKADHTWIEAKMSHQILSYLTINNAGAPLEDTEPDSSPLRQGWLSPTSDSQGVQRDRCWGRGRTIITAWGILEYLYALLVWVGWGKLIQMWFITLCIRCHSQGEEYIFKIKQERCFPSYFSIVPHRNNYCDI